MGAANEALLGIAGKLMVADTVRKITPEGALGLSCQLKFTRSAAERRLCRLLSTSWRAATSTSACPGRPASGLAGPGSAKVFKLGRYWADYALMRIEAELTKRADAAQKKKEEAERQEALAKKKAAKAATPRSPTKRVDPAHDAAPDTAEMLQASLTMKKTGIRGSGSGARFGGAGEVSKPPPAAEGGTGEDGAQGCYHKSKEGAATAKVVLATKAVPKTKKAINSLWEHFKWLAGIGVEEDEEELRDAFLGQVGGIYPLVTVRAAAAHCSRLPGAGCLLLPDGGGSENARAIAS